MARPMLTPKEVNDIKIRLINTAIIAIKKNGFDKVSIKTIASLSKINSAIIYKYFKNLDELIIYAYVDKFYSYYDEIAKVDFKKMDKKDIYIITWKYFSDFSYDNKEILDTLFFKGVEYNLKHIIYDYSLLYNKKSNITNESVLNMLADDNIYDRNFYVLKPILTNQYTDDEIFIINTMIINSFQVELKKLIKHNNTLSKDDFVNNICKSNELLINSLLH